MKWTAFVMHEVVDELNEERGRGHKVHVEDGFSRNVKHI